MDRTMILDAYDPQCPIRNVLARMSDKWSLLVIYTLTQSEKVRFGDIRRAIPDISQKMLTVTLRTLEEDGLTARAYSLFPHIQSLIMWAKENMTDIIDDRKRNKNRE